MSHRASVDILLITYNRPEYTRLSLSSLLSTCDEDTRVWVWHNGTHEETLEVVKSFLGHPALFRFHHSVTNEKLRTPTNWFWTNARGELLGKIDDDCFCPQGWIDMLRRAHEQVPELGVLACWGFMEEDFDLDLARWKIRDFAGRHQVIQNLWVAGRGYLMKRECFTGHGVIRSKESFTDYCVRLAGSGWVNGWYYPLIVMEHMDDPRAPHTSLRTDEDLRRHLPLSAVLYEERVPLTLETYRRGLQNTARTVQMASIDPRDYEGWRRAYRRLMWHVCRLIAPAKAAMLKVPLHNRRGMQELQTTGGREEK